MRNVRILCSNCPPPAATPALFRHSLTALSNVDETLIPAYPIRSRRILVARDVLDFGLVHPLLRCVSEILYSPPGSSLEFGGHKFGGMKSSFQECDSLASSMS